MSPRTTQIRALAAVGLALGACAIAPAASQAAVTQKGTIVRSVAGPGDVDGCTSAGGKVCTSTHQWPSGDDAPEVQLSANPIPAYYTVSWSGCDDNGNGTCNAIPSSVGTKVSASFAPAPQLQADNGVYGGDASHRVFAPVVRANSSYTQSVEFLVDGVSKDTETGGSNDTFTGQVNVAGLQSGTHGLEARITDTYGKTVSLNGSVKVDNTAPEVSITGGPADGAVIDQPTFDATFTASAPDGGAFTRRCGISKNPDAVSAIGCGSDTTSSYSTVFEKDMQGTFYWTVSVFDELGNISTARRTVTIDTTDPKLVVNDPAEGSTTQSATQTVTPVVTDANPGTVTCALDGAAAKDCKGGITYTGLANGLHKVVVKATDKAGHSVSLMRTWGVAVPASSGGGTNTGGGSQQSSNTTTTNTISTSNTTTTTTNTTGKAAGLTASLKAPKNARRSRLARGLKVKVHCSAACAGTVTLKAGGLKLTGKVKLTKAGTATVSLKPGKKAGSAAKASKAKVSSALSGKAGAAKPSATIALK